MDLAILAAARFSISPPFAGGMEMHTHVLGNGLVARGHRVTVYAAGGEGRFAVRPMIPMAFACSPQARRDITAGPTDAVAEHHSYLEAIVHLATAGHDLVHLNAVHHLPFACAGLLPCVVTATLHSPPTPWLESALAISTIRGNAPHLASVSSANAASWGELAVERVIGNGVDLQVWRPGPGGDGAAWTGRIVAEKAPHLAIDACRTAGMSLRLMGPVHDEDYFATQIRPRLGAGIDYLGHGDVADVVALVGSSAVALVTPTWEEPFGLVVTEALACGTPVTGFRRGALPDLVDATTGVLAPPDDVEALAAALLQAATLDRRDCRARAERKFSADVMIDAYEAWFEDLVAS